MLEWTDTHGYGHISHALSGRDFHPVLINLDDELIAERRRRARSGYCAATPHRTAGRDFKDRQLPYIFESPREKMTKELPLKGFRFVEKSADLNLCLSTSAATPSAVMPSRWH